MHSPYRILQSSNTNTRKQKSSKESEHDLKMTLKDLNEVDKPVSKKLKTKNNLRGGDPCYIQIDGRDLIEQAFSSN